MPFFIVPLVLVLIVAPIVFWRLRRPHWNQYGFFGAAAAALGWSAATVAASIFLWAVLSEDLGPARVETEQLQALSVDKSLNGSFFLGSGTVDEEPVFYYYQKNEDGSFFLDYAYAEDVTIVEDSGPPRYDQTCHALLQFWPGDYQPWHAGDISDQAAQCDRKATFYVPEGSVTQSYNLDLPGSQ